jgi:hypothetical protein
LDSGIWIAIYLPIMMLIIASIQQMRFHLIMILRKNRKRGMSNMNNDLLNKYIGKICKISTGSYGNSIKGRILEIHDNWMEIETSKGRELVNAEFVQNIRIIKG